MPLFRQEEERERIPIGDDWIEVRRTLTYGDRKYAQGRATAGGYTYKQGNRRRGQEGETTAHFNVGEYNLALLERMITGWSESTVPISREKIEELPERTVDLLMAKIDEWNPVLSEEEAGPLKNESSPASQQPGATGVSPTMMQDGQNDSAILPTIAKS